ncbi:MAG: DNA recombination protein RmuC [Candidatus Micrarchaeota archaeon]|nr:DNA recombination protein RmuC [Candidatus Micrarchaeota archaeon]
MDPISVVIILGFIIFIAITYYYFSQIIHRLLKKEELFENSIKELQEVKTQLYTMKEVQAQTMNTFIDQINKINRYISSTYGKGSVGENIIEEQLDALIKFNFVNKNVNLGNNKIVEYALTLKDGKYLPIDSKMLFEIDNLEKTEKGNNSGISKDIVKKDAVKKIKLKINEVEKYKNLPRSCDYVILAVPDEFYHNTINDVFSEATEKNIIICAYSNLISTCYLFKLYYDQLTEKDYSDLYERIQSLEQTILLIKEKSNTISNAVKMIENANSEIQERINKTKKVD